MQLDFLFGICLLSRNSIFFLYKLNLEKKNFSHPGYTEKLKALLKYIFQKVKIKKGKEPKTTKYIQSKKKKKNKKSGDLQLYFMIF